MTAEPKRVRVNEEIERLLEEAANQPLIAESEGNVYRIYAERVLPPSPYTIDTIYSSLPSPDGMNSSDISNDELQEMIEAGKEENLKIIVEGMNEG